MGGNIQAGYAWYSPDVATYGNGGGRVSNGAGMLELDNTTTAFQAVEPLLGSVGTNPVTAAIIKQFSQEDAGDAVDVKRTIYDNLVQTAFPFGAIRLQLHTVVTDTTGGAEKYKFRLNDDDTEDENDSTTTTFAFGHGNQYDILITTDSVNWILYVDGVEEIRVAHTLRMFNAAGTSTSRLLAQGSNDSGSSSTRNEGFAAIRYDGSADLPDIASTVFAELTLAGESATHTDYIDGQGGPNGHPLAANVDDWESGAADDDTTVDSMTTEAGVTKLQAYTTPTYTVVNDHVAVVSQYKDRANTGNKFSAANTFMYDGSNITHASPTIPTTAWVSVRRIFPLAPDGSTTWKNFSSWPGLELGHRTETDPDEDAESINLTAIQGEILDLAVVATAPPSTAEFEIMGIF